MFLSLFSNSGVPDNFFDQRNERKFGKLNDMPISLDFTLYTSLSTSPLDL